MKVTCQGCNGTFKVKGEVAPGRAFKFKCPKCGTENRLVAEEEASPPVGAPPKTQCEKCGKAILTPKEGPMLCDQCRASKAVEEVRKKSQALMEDSGIEFPDEIFDTAESTPAATDKEAPPPETVAPEPPKIEEKIEKAGGELIESEIAKMS